MREDEAKTVFVCNTITGDVYEVQKGFDIDATCISKIQKRAKAHGEEYMAFVLPGDVKRDDIEKLANAVADWSRFQDTKLPVVVYGTQEWIESLTAGMEKTYGKS